MNEPNETPHPLRPVEDLAPVAESIGVPIGDNRIAPQIDSRGLVSGIARQAGQLLRKTPLFARGKDLVTVDENGQQEPMNASRFISWVEDFIRFGHYSETNFAPKSISAERAGQILTADHFRRELRPLSAVHDVRLPTWTDEKKNGVRLLEPGYDEAMGIFTAPSLDYPADIPLPEAWDFLRTVYAEFPFGEGAPPERNRSFAVQFTAHLAVYGRLLFSDALRPAFVYLGNQQGCGKTLLAKMALAPVFGAKVSAEGFPRAEEEREKRLTTLVGKGRPFVLYDNVKGFLSSAELEGFLTSPMRTGRILGRSDEITAPNLATVFITGNNLTLSADLARRSLVVDLFCQRDATDRDFEEPITDRWTADPENRARFLAAQWAILEHWQAMGCRRSTSNILPSFEEFSAVVGGITEAVNLPSPFTGPEIEMDEQGAAWKMLLRAMADQVDAGQTRDFPREDAMEIAESLGITETLLAGARDEAKAFGARIKAYAGQIMRDNGGREFQVSRRRRNSNFMLYPVTVFEAKPSENG